MSGIIDVDTGAMRHHAKRVGSLVDRAEVAAEAARQVSFHPSIYGLIGADLVYPLLKPLEEAGVIGTSAVAGALAGTALGLDAMANSFDFVDDAVRGALRAIHSELR